MPSGTWPSFFPGVQAGLSQEFVSPVEISEMESGEIRHRKDRRGKMQRVGVSWVFEGNLMAMFLAWHNYRLNKGKDYFLISLPLGRDSTAVAQYTARFADGQFSVALKELPNTWLVTSRLEVFN